MITMHYGHNLSIYFEEDNDKRLITLPCFISENVEHPELIEANINGNHYRYVVGESAVELAGDYISLEDERSILVMLAGLLQLPVQEVNELNIVANREYAEQLRIRLLDLQGEITLADQTVNILLERVNVYPEFSAAFFDLYLSRSQEMLVNKDDFLETVNLILSVNGRQTEWVLFKGLNILKGGILYFSINTILLEIKDYYHKKTEKSLQPSAAMLALYTHKISIKANKTESIDAVLDEGKSKLVNKIIDATSNLADECQPDRVLITGEGASYLNQNHIDTLLDSGLEIVKNAEYTLIRGSFIIHQLQRQGIH